MSSITKSFMAYENETDSFLIDNLTVENRLDKISLHGSVEITKDIAGLEHALKLKRVIDASIEALKRDKQLPKRIQANTDLPVTNIR